MAEGAPKRPLPLATSVATIGALFLTHGTLELKGKIDKSLDAPSEYTQADDDQAVVAAAEAAGGGILLGMGAGVMFVRRMRRRPGGKTNESEARTTD